MRLGSVVGSKQQSLFQSADVWMPCTCRGDWLLGCLSRRVLRQCELLPVCLPAALGLLNSALHVVLVCSKASAGGCTREAM
jgi:hypothetical protein